MLFDLLSRVKLLRPIERFLVYWFDVSIISRQVSGQAGVAPVATFTLTTIGRTSGDLLGAPLFYFRDDKAFIVVGSVGGAPKHPSWFLNLQADPHAWIRIKRRQTAVRAELVEGADRAPLWEMVVRGYPSYAEYQERAAPREIPIMRLTPVSG